MSLWPVVASSLGSALAFAVATTLKHHSAGKVPDAQDLAPRSLARMIRVTVAHPAWLAGIAADAVGLSLQVVALHLGALAIVQPLLISGLLFALLLRQGAARRLHRAEVGWAVVVTAALAGFLALVGNANGPAPQGVDRLPAIAAGSIGLIAAAVCVFLGRRVRSSGLSAAVLGVAVGTIYAGTAALLKSVTGLALQGPVELLTSWQLYALLAAGATGLVLNQLAFQAGPLTASLPAIATTDPLLSIVLGVLVYDEPVRHGAASGAGLIGVLVVLGVSVIQLSRLEGEQTTVGERHVLLQPD